jgi:hypothetical protein
MVITKSGNNSSSYVFSLTSFFFNGCNLLFVTNISLFPENILLFPLTFLFSGILLLLRVNNLSLSSS